MRLLVYNIAYGTGPVRSRGGLLLSLGRYLHTNKRDLARIRQYIELLHPDVTGLVEVDLGSIRTGFHNQAWHLAEGLDLLEYGKHCKYAPGSLADRLPILRKQANSFLVRNNGETAECRYHYFPVGMKRLILELQYKQVHFILLHLALDKITRRKQLIFLQKELRSLKGPCIIAGDLNTFQGEKELANLCKVLKMRSANEKRLPTYPSWKPRFQLDHILCSEEIHVEEFRVLDQVRASDHLPLLLDFQLKTP